MIRQDFSFECYKNGYTFYTARFPIEKSIPEGQTYDLQDFQITTSLPSTAYYFTSLPLYESLLPRLLHLHPAVNRQPGYRRVDS